MAYEITASANLTARKNNAVVTGVANFTATMTGNNMVSNTQSIGTSAEPIDFGDISGAPAAVLIRNLDSTNYVEIGGDSGLTVFKIKIPAGQCALFTPSSGTVYAKANTAAVLVQVTAVEA